MYPGRSNISTLSGLHKSTYSTIYNQNPREGRERQNTQQGKAYTQTTQHTEHTVQSKEWIHDTFSEISSKQTKLQHEYSEIIYPEELDNYANIRTFFLH